MTNQNAAATTEATTQKARVFHATVTPAEIELKTTAKGTPYALMKGAKVNTTKRGDSVGTVMAFGKAFETISEKLAVGEPVKLALVRDGGTLNAVGFAWSKEEREAYKAQRQAA